MKNTHIAIISSAGGGKDFSAEYIIKKCGHVRYAFADNVKMVAEKWFPNLYGEGKKKPRWLLQAIGTNFRDIDEDTWVDALFRDIDEKQDELRKSGYTEESIIITDCRMPNEYEALKERGFVFIRVNASPEVREARMIARGDIFKKEDMNHHTESFYDSFECDYSIDNNGTPDELYEQLDGVISSILRNAQK